VGGMRPFAEMAWEFIRMAVPIVEGVSIGKWEDFKAEKPGSKSELLRLWDKQITELNEKFPRFHYRMSSLAIRELSDYEQLLSISDKYVLILRYAASLTCL
jgi:hypothetical protein